jgi:magnesium transporter
MIGMCTGGFFGVLCGFAVACLQLGGDTMSPAMIGLIVGVGLMGACLAGTFLGAFSPFFFVRLGVDPAIASGPIITAFNDILSMSSFSHRHWAKYPPLLKCPILRAK